MWNLEENSEKISLIKEQLLPNRHTKINTFRDNENGEVLKQFVNCNVTAIKEHYFWLQKLQCPAFPQILSWDVKENSFSVRLEGVSGRDFWSYVGAWTTEEVIKRAREVISFISNWGDEKYQGMLSPAHSFMHGDFHLGHIYYEEGQEEFDVSKVRLIDLDSVGFGPRSRMEEEVLLNLFAHPKTTEAERKLITNEFSLEGVTLLEKYEHVRKIDRKFYDYYREFDNFFGIHKTLKEGLSVRLRDFR